MHVAQVDIASLNSGAQAYANEKVSSKFFLLSYSTCIQMMCVTAVCMPYGLQWQRNPDSSVTKRRARASQTVTILLFFASTLSTLNPTKIWILQHHSEERQQNAWSNLLKIKQDAIQEGDNLKNGGPWKETGKLISYNITVLHTCKQKGSSSASSFQPAQLTTRSQQA